MAAHVTFADKTQTLPYDASKINASDINDLKAAINLLQATVIAATTDSSTGVSGGDTIGVVTNPDLSTWNGSSVFPTATQATAIGTAVTELKAAVATLVAKQNAILVVLKASGLMATS